ncbi:MAG: hypothetical protein ACRDRL_26910 [Sciscionella sp.]
MGDAMRRPLADVAMRAAEPSEPLADYDGPRIDRVAFTRHL